MKLGEKQVLTVVKTVDFGVYLGSDEERVLLRRSRSPKELRSEIRWKCSYIKIRPTV